MSHLQGLSAHITRETQALASFGGGNGVIDGGSWTKVMAG